MKKELPECCRHMRQIIAQYGIPLLVFYSILNIIGEGVDRLRSLDEKYNLVKGFGLDRIC